MTTAKRMNGLLRLLASEGVVTRTRIEAVLFSYMNYESPSKISDFLHEAMDAGIMAIEGQGWNVRYTITDHGRAKAIELGMIADPSDPTDRSDAVKEIT